MIPTTFTIFAQCGQNFFKVDLEGREAFGPNEQVQAEAFARQLLKVSQGDEAKRIDRVFVMKHLVARVYGAEPVHPENRKEN
jgi:hypothetical protein